MKEPFHGLPCGCWPTDLVWRSSILLVTTGTILSSLLCYVLGQITTVQFQRSPWMAYGELIFSGGQSQPSLFSFFSPSALFFLFSNILLSDRQELRFQKLGSQYRHQPWAEAHGKPFRDRAHNSTSQLYTDYLILSQCFLPSVLIFSCCVMSIFSSVDALIF